MSPVWEKGLASDNGHETNQTAAAQGALRMLHPPALAVAVPQLPGPHSKGQKGQDFRLGNRPDRAHWQGSSVRAGLGTGRWGSRQLSRSASPFSASPRSRRRRPATDEPTLTHYPALRPPDAGPENRGASSHTCRPSRSTLGDASVGMDSCSLAACGDGSRCSPHRGPRRPGRFSPGRLRPRPAGLLWTWLLAAVLLNLAPAPRLGAVAMRAGRVTDLRRETVGLFYHGFDNYMRVAFPEDEVRLFRIHPRSCTDTSIS